MKLATIAIRETEPHAIRETCGHGERGLWRKRNGGDDREHREHDRADHTGVAQATGEIEHALGDPIGA